MNFWASAEVFKDAFPALDRARRCVEPHLNAAFAASSLAELQAKIRYIPIVMPGGARERYPARSKLRKKQQLYDCSPQLNYEVFVKGTFEDQLREYLRGIREVEQYLPALGATAAQIEDFATILNQAVASVLVERRDQTRH